MNILEAAGIAEVFHYTPLHYLPFIARIEALLSKPAIRAHGFSETHFRSKSHRHDIARGFGSYSFLTLHSAPPILRAKLSAGFPHISISIPVTAVDNVPFDLCRFNVAMTRRLRREGKPGFAESSTNGRYYGDLQIPIAKSNPDKAAMLARYAGTDSMIEVLVPGELRLPTDTSVICFSRPDYNLAADVLSAASVKWRLTLRAPPSEYVRSSSYARSVETFVTKAVASPGWSGDPLEFDRV